MGEEGCLIVKGESFCFIFDMICSVVSDLGSVQKLRPHLVDAKKIKYMDKTYKLIYVNINKFQRPKMLL